MHAVKRKESGHKTAQHIYYITKARPLSILYLPKIFG